MFVKVKLPSIMGTAALLALVHSTTYSATPTTEQPWGEIVEGAQLRLTVVPDSPTAIRPTQAGLPLIQIELRNQGTRTIGLSDNDLSASEIEVDGVAYRQTFFATNGFSSAIVELKPGEHARPIRLNDLMRNGVNAVSDHHALVLSPGPHAVRIRTQLDGRWKAPPRLRNGELAEVPQLQSQPIKVSSNLLEVVVPPAPSSSAEQPWGEMVDGLQLRLTVVPEPPLTASSTQAALPLLQVEMRNAGTQSIGWSVVDLYLSLIEVDGVKYGSGGFFASDGFLTVIQELNAGTHSAPIRLQKLSDLKAVSDGHRLSLSPGLHTVVIKSRFTGQSIIPVRQAPPHQRQPIDVASNLLTVVVPSDPSTN